MFFHVARSEHEGWVRLAVVGELDLAAAPRVRQAIIPLIPPPVGPPSDEVPHVLLDLSEVDFIDSAGLGVVVGAARRVRGASGELAVVASDHVRGVFAVIGLDRIITTHARLGDVPAAPEPANIPAGATVVPSERVGDG